MNFVELMQGFQAKVLQTPTKWRDDQIFQALEKCKTIKDINRVVRFCSYDKVTSVQDNVKTIKYLPGRALVLVLIIRSEIALTLEKLTRECVQDIQRDLALAISSKHLTPKFLWKVCVAKVKAALILTSLTKDEDDSCKDDFCLQNSIFLTFLFDWR